MMSNMEYRDECLMEFRFKLYGQVEGFYFILVDRKLSLNEQKHLENDIERYKKEHREVKPERLIFEVMNQEGLSWRMIPYARTIRV